jgi:hypothetical protein
MNSEEFYTEISKLNKSFENRNLEEYLLALYQNVIEYKSDKISYELILKIITKSFTTEPVSFNNEWLKYRTAPDENRISKKFTSTEINSSIDKSNYSELKPFDFTIEVIKFQIAELHKMKDKQLQDEYRYFGITSETGNSWYNFDAFGNLECGARCMVDNEEDFENLDWSFIGELLENGRIYE